MSSAVCEAANSVKQGLPGLSTQSSLPCKTILSTKSAAAGLSSVSGADKASDPAGKESPGGRSQSVPPSAVTQPVRVLPTLRNSGKLSDCPCLHL